VVGLYTTPIPKTDPDGDGETEPEVDGEAVGLAVLVGLVEPVGLGLAVSVGLGLAVSVGLGDGVEVSDGLGDAVAVWVWVAVLVGVGAGVLEQAANAQGKISANTKAPRPRGLVNPRAFTFLSTVMRSSRATRRHPRDGGRRRGLFNLNPGL